MGIENIPTELQELTDWSKVRTPHSRTTPPSLHGVYRTDGLYRLQEYEIANLLPSKICQDVAGPTVNLLLFNTPAFLHFFGKLAVSALLDDRLRAAVMFVEFRSPRSPFSMLHAPGLTRSHRQGSRCAGTAHDNPQISGHLSRTRRQTSPPPQIDTQQRPSRSMASSSIPSSHLLNSIDR